MSDTNDPKAASFDELLRSVHVTFDMNRAAHQTVGGYIAPRTDLPEPEQYFVAVSEDGKLPFGLFQKFENGTVAYWRFPMRQANLASSMEEAYERVRVVMMGTSHPIVCHRCHSPYLSDGTIEERNALFSDGAIPLTCKKCGAQISTRYRNPPDPPRVT